MADLEALSVQIDRTGQVSRLEVAGELDIATVPDLEGAFEQVRREDPQTIVIDLSQVTFIDSTGVRLLLLMTERCDGALGMVLSPQVDRVVEITGIRPSLPVVQE